MPELTITSSYVDSDTFTTGNLMPESTLTLRQSQLYPSVRDFGFGLKLLYMNNRARSFELLLVKKFLKN